MYRNLIYLSIYLRYYAFTSIPPNLVQHHWVSIFVTILKMKNLTPIISKYIYLFVNLCLINDKEDASSFFSPLESLLKQ